MSSQIGAYLKMSSERLHPAMGGNRSKDPQSHISLNSENPAEAGGEL